MTRSEYESHFLNPSPEYNPGSMTVKSITDSALPVIETEIMFQDPSVRIVACDVDFRPPLRNIDA